ncbi:hypothetical protein OMR07_09195 [Methylobacterium organophilum]|nr:hypothetical protein [Methylobacterium organophilum]
MSKTGGNDSKSTLYCSFCGKSQHEVRKLIDRLPGRLADHDRGAVRRGAGSGWRAEHSRPRAGPEAASPCRSAQAGQGADPGRRGLRRAGRRGGGGDPGAGRLPADGPRERGQVGRTDHDPGREQEAGDDVEHGVSPRSVFEDRCARRYLRKPCCGNIASRVASALSGSHRADGRITECVVAESATDREAARVTGRGTRCEAR